MIYVGIDVASDKHDFCIIRDTGEPLTSSQFANTAAGYEKLLRTVQKAKELSAEMAEKEWRKDDGLVRIGLESTGPYSPGIYHYLRERFNDVVLINPTLTHMFQMSTKVHYAKTDSIDALGICKYLVTNPVTKTYAEVSYHTQEIRSLYRCIVGLDKRLNKAKSRLLQMLHVTFPELKGTEKAFTKAELELLSRYPTPKDMLSTTPKKMAKELGKIPYLHFTEEDAEEIISKAKNTIGTDREYSGFQIQFDAQEILLTEGQKKKAVKRLDVLLKEEYPYMLDIPGAGTISIAGVVGEIGNIDNFHSPDSIVAYAGLAPLVYESGKYKAMRTKITKNGSPYLRNALVMMARCMCQQKQKEMLDFVNGKRREGKSDKCAKDHAARKLCSMLYHKMKHKDAFDPSKFLAYKPTDSH